MINAKDKKLGELRVEARRSTLRSKQKDDQDEDLEEGSRANQWSIREVKGKHTTGQYPLIIEEGRAKYVPWQNQDLECLVKELPNIYAGAAKRDWHWVT